MPLELLRLRRRPLPEHPRESWPSPDQAFMDLAEHALQAARTPEAVAELGPRKASKKPKKAAKRPRKMSKLR
jgi:hypothetical protein